MQFRLVRPLALGVLALAAGCSSPSEAEPPQSAPQLSAQVRAKLATLRYDEGPPPPDISNAKADDPAARIFGQRLFFDPRLSGPLIEFDNDGSEVALGKVGETGRVSCAGCHVPADGFVDTRSRGQTISLAAQWVLRRTPTLLDVAFPPLYSWDGRRDSLWRQSVAVMESDREFNSSRLYVAQQVRKLYAAEYTGIFGDLPPLEDGRRFPDLDPAQAGCVELSTASGAVFECHGNPGDAAEYDSMSAADQTAVTRVVVNLGKALGAYLRRLRCGPSRFDTWLDGDESALTPAELRGAALFVGKADCVRCHSGPRLTDDAYHNVGLEPELVATVFLDADDRGAIEGLAHAKADPLNVQGAFSDGDDGRLPDAVGPELEGAFRTPGLRCIASQPSFMHTAHMKSLAEVIEFFDDGGDTYGYPGQSELTRLGLSEQERADLVSFIQALSGPGPDPTLLAPP